MREIYCCDICGKLGSFDEVTLCEKKHEEERLKKEKDSLVKKQLEDKIKNQFNELIDSLTEYFDTYESNTLNFNLPSTFYKIIDSIIN